jgi:hypothetical protein
MPWLEAFLPDGKVKDTSEVLIRTVNLTSVELHVGKRYLHKEEAIWLQCRVAPRELPSLMKKIFFMRDGFFYFMMNQWEDGCSNEY